MGLIIGLPLYCVLYLIHPMLPLLLAFYCAAVIITAFIENRK